MDLKLNGKIALITGSTAGIGLAIVESLAREGAYVYLNGRTKKRVDTALSEVRSRVPDAKVDGIVADLSDASGAKNLVERLPEVDVLVNNVGIFEPKPFLELPDEDWYRFFEVNVMSGVRLSRHYLAGMLEKKWGRILFISSESGVQIPAEMVHYGMTKTAQIAIARGIAESCAGTGVTVNSIWLDPQLQKAWEALSRPWPFSRTNLKSRWSKSSLKGSGRLLCSSGSRRWRKSLPWSPTLRATSRLRRMAPPCAWTVAS